MIWNLVSYIWVCCKLPWINFINPIPPIQWLKCDQVTNLSISIKLRWNYNPTNHLLSFLTWASPKGMLITNLGTYNNGTSMDSGWVQRASPSLMFTGSLLNIYQAPMGCRDYCLALKCFLNFVDRKTKSKTIRASLLPPKPQEGSILQRNIDSSYHTPSLGLWALDYTLSHCTCI